MSKIIKKETIKKDKVTKCYFTLLVLKAKLIEEKVKGKEIDFMYNNCDVESFIFNRVVYLQY
jgi:hypothetical protein